MERLVVLALLVTSCVSVEPVQPGDASLVVRVDDLASYGLTVPSDYQQHESLQREHYFGGVVMIEYEFSLPGDEPPFVYALAELHRTASDACRSFRAGNLGLQLGGLELTDRDDVFQYGEKSRFGLIENEGGPVGNLFHMCRSRTALLVMFVGIYFDEREAWEEFISPHLRALEAFEAANPR